ncbi:hypothetical protein A1OO_22110 [Enterovibrio norvegicus FF-33]|uniref:hypothetical protein n=1 Tax=Enterovibrio norvegicus TaxID=188144 RepID=UPI000307359B|nr:hypothetical protein [Enterovibrio norvegicus]OEE70916.1 hypothetical protein A1OO_22110 [Enterovibrio norvegicus FF-33]
MSSQKETDTKLPPLLPLEYCTVERAARLLGCEVEDIHHWHDIGAIKLCANFQKRVLGKVKISMRNILDKEDSLPSAYLRDAVEKAAEKHTKLRDLALLQSEKNNLVIKVYEYFLVGERGCPVVPMCVYHENGTAIWNADNCSVATNGLEADAHIAGFWGVSSFERYSSDDQTIELVSYEVEASWGDELKGIEIRVDKDLWNGEFYLLRRDILKIHKATHSMEGLPNRYNDVAIAEVMNDREYVAEELFTKFKTSQDTRGIALGIMAKLVGQSKPNKFIRGKKINSSELMKTIEQECARIGIGPLSGEVRKDISQCVEAVEREVENSKKHNKPIY